MPVFGDPGGVIVRDREGIIIKLFFLHIFAIIEKRFSTVPFGLVTSHVVEKKFSTLGTSYSHQNFVLALIQTAKLR